MKMQQIVSCDKCPGRSISGFRSMIAILLFVMAALLLVESNQAASSSSARSVGMGRAYLSLARGV
ncbi:MAG: hypothetical protein P1R58_10205, partial [bacterium]|nr:hypothetical protein [bacterium]